MSFGRLAQEGLPYNPDNRWCRRNRDRPPCCKGSGRFAEERACSAITDALSTIEIVKAEAPAYFPAAAVGIGTLGCIFGANILNLGTSLKCVCCNQMYGKYKDKVSLFGDEGDYMVERAIEQADRDVEDDRPPWDRCRHFTLR